MSRGEARRRALVDAAWTLFKERGIEATTLDEIISRAGGSRTTIYSAFGDKDGLIETAVGESCSAFAERMMEMLDDSSDPAAALTSLATDLVTHIWTPEAMRIFGSFLTEGDRFPQVIDAFMNNGPIRLERRLTAFLTAVRDSGRAPVADPAYAAKMFLDALHGDWLIGCLGGARTARDPASAETARWIRHVVAHTLDRPLDTASPPSPD
ncbi:MAG: TetR/AcrR family transcriptional regulator [Thalassobaculaceae bacterium]|nr:TetR/AcrR family transcriptional regulator [Thalassobaculaceae bacterium]